MGYNTLETTAGNLCVLKNKTQNNLVNKKYIEIRYENKNHF